MKKAFPLLTFTAFLLIASSFIPVAMAEATQWFPSAGTVQEYDLKWQLAYTNGTMLIEDHFNIYNQSGNIYAVPFVYVSKINTSSWTLLMSNIPIMLQHEYGMFNSTHLNRSASLYLNGSVFNATSIRISVYTTTSSYYHRIDLDTDYMQTSNFFVNPERFPDHLNLAAQPFQKAAVHGEYSSNYDLTMLASTDSTIVANWEYPGVTLTINVIVIADGSGRIFSFTRSSWRDTFSSYGLSSSSLQFTSRTGPSTGGNGIPGFNPVYLVIISLAAFVMIAKKSKRLDLR